MEDKKTNYRTIIVLSSIVLGFAITFSLKQNDSFFKYSKQIDIEGDLPALDFTLPGLNGELISLSDFKGSVVLVNVWATWCPPCVYEMPSMEKLYQQFKSENFKILAVSIDSLGAKTVVPFMKNHNLTFQALIDPAGTIRIAYGINGIPESFIIDKQGNIIKKIIGPIDWATPEIFNYFRDLIFYADTRYRNGYDIAQVRMAVDKMFWKPLR
jgi:peroxiredoxin